MRKLVFILKVVNFKKILLFVIVLINMVFLVSAFSFADLFNNYLTGEVVSNKDPSVTLGAPSYDQVVNNPVTFTWVYFDPEDDPLEEYAILVDDNKRFTSPIAYYGIKGDSQKIYLPLEDGQYYWRVEVTNKFGNGISEVRGFYLNTKEKVCSDGTKYYECSVNKPDYCRSGVIVQDCIRCGCDRGSSCGIGGVCVEQKCVDGTIYGDCSMNKPKYCINTGVLRDTCSLCGCPDSFECSSDGSCKEKVVEEVNEEQDVVVEQQETGLLGILKRVARIFKYLFTGQSL